MELFTCCTSQKSERGLVENWRGCPPPPPRSLAPVSNSHCIAVSLCLTKGKNLAPAIFRVSPADSSKSSTYFYCPYCPEKRIITHSDQESNKMSFQLHNQCTTLTHWLQSCETKQKKLHKDYSCMSSCQKT